MCLSRREATLMTDVIYLAPLCQEHERMWCEHDAPVDCECIDGPHPWIKYVTAPQQPAQSEITQADTAAMESILWVDTIIDDKEAIAKAFACHRDYGYDRGYYDGCAHTMDAWNRRDDVLRDALADLLHAVCGQTGFAETVRRDSGRIYPWPALDLAEAKAIAALDQSK